MDTKNLEMIGITAQQHVQRCTPTYPSSTTCRSRHERSLLRLHEPYTRELLRYRRFVFKVTRGSEGAAPMYAFDLLRPAIDVALFELLIGRCTKRLAGWRAFVEEADKAIEPGPTNRNRGPLQGVAKLPKGAETCLYPLSSRSRSQGYRSMKLTER